MSVYRASECRPRRRPLHRYAVPLPMKWGGNEKPCGGGYRSLPSQTLQISGIGPGSRLFASLGTLVGYGSGMAGKADEAAWLAAVFDRLKALTDQAIAVIAAAEPPADVAEAEKRARAVGVLARTAKAVAALRPARKSRTSEEDEMSEDDRDVSDAELAGLQAEFFARVDHLVAAFERKSLTAGLDRGAAARGEDPGAAGGDPGDAEAERRTDLAA
ncbi:hypothetical protein [Brevundimonas sp. MYb52]|uniref:hypothetical protein n=1 Tax=Brevundimonas sp. MYb52 TaxID=1848622 RepID=UPI0011B04E44|nr:hypothetical protein [Brevundimonas sp. MYb52]